MNNTLRELMTKSKQKPATTGIANFKLTLELAIAKENLKKTDEIFIACSEASTLGLPCPYTQEYLEQIGAQRQALRDKIAELEG